MTVPEDYAIAIPEVLEDTQAAPLLCAGAIGYRALRLSAIADGEPLGLMGFGGSAHSCFAGGEASVSTIARLRFRSRTVGTRVRGSVRRRLGRRRGPIAPPATGIDHRYHTGLATDRRVDEETATGRSLGHQRDSQGR